MYLCRARVRVAFFAASERLCGPLVFAACLPDAERSEGKGLCHMSEVNCAKLSTWSFDLAKIIYDLINER